jgi:virginiamycin B lyase
LTEYDVGGNSKIASIANNGDVWFTAEGESKPPIIVSYLGNVEPSSGKITKFFLAGLSDLRGLVCGPANLGFGDNSNSSVWFVQKSGNRITRLNPTNGEVASWTVPTSGSGPFGIAIHRYGSIFNNTLFFTEYDANRVGAFRMIGGQGVFKEFLIPTSNSKPLDIAIDNRGYVWFTMFEVDKIGKLDPWNGAITEYPVLGGSRPWGITVDSNGVVWFTMSEVGRIAKLDPRSGLCVSYEIPTPASKPRHIMVDSWGSVWFTEYDPGKVGRYFPENEAFLEYSLPNSISGPDTIVLGSQSEVWVAENRVGRIARIIPSTKATISTGTIMSGVETVSSTAYSTSISTGRLTGLTFTASSVTTVVATTVSTIIVTTSTTSTTTTTATPPTLTTILTVTTVPARACLVASAAYESELAAPVQLLRGFRDEQVASTFAGSRFMEGFNTFYYSFSPSVAERLADSSFLRVIVKILLYPLVEVLRISSAVYAAFSFCREFAVTVAGVVASFLIGLTYGGILVVASICVRLIHAKRRGHRGHI